MADPSPVRVTLEIPRADVESAVKLVLDQHSKSSVDEVIRVFKNDIVSQLDATQERVSGTRDRIGEIDDQLRAKEESVNRKLDELQAKILAASETANQKLKELDTEVHTKVTRYLVPAGLVVVVSIVLGAFGIFGGFKVQDKIAETLKSATDLQKDINAKASDFEGTKNTLATLNGKIDEATKQTLLGQNAKLIDQNGVLSRKLTELQSEVDALKKGNSGGETKQRNETETKNSKRPSSK